MMPGHMLFLFAMSPGVDQGSQKHHSLSKGQTHILHYASATKRKCFVAAPNESISPFCGPQHKFKFLRRPQTPFRGQNTSHFLLPGLGFVSTWAAHDKFTCHTTQLRWVMAPFPNPSWMGWQWRTLSNRCLRYVSDNPISNKLNWPSHTQKYTGMSLC